MWRLVKHFFVHDWTIIDQFILKQRGQVVVYHWRKCRQCPETDYRQAMAYDL